MARNRFPKGTLVKLLMCGHPGCACANKYLLGENGRVTNARGRLIVVECQKGYMGLLARVVHFRKETADSHLERLDPPLRRAKHAPTPTAHTP